MLWRVCSGGTAWLRGRSCAWLEGFYTLVGGPSLRHNSTGARCPVLSGGGRWGEAADRATMSRSNRGSFPICAAWLPHVTAPLQPNTARTLTRSATMVLSLLHSHYVPGDLKQSSGRRCSENRVTLASGRLLKLRTHRSQEAAPPDADGRPRRQNCSEPRSLFLVSATTIHSLVAGPSLREHLLQINRNDIWVFPRSEMPPTQRFTLVDHRSYHMLA